MGRVQESHSEWPRLRFRAWVVAAAWTTVIATFFVWDLLGLRQDMRERALMEARGSANKDLLLQRWISGHGGVYVVVDENTPPNPNLAHVAERDVKTATGKSLTMMNAAYVMRQIYQSCNGSHGIRGHFTSLKPIREENGPDDWERKALRAFEAGEKEYCGVATIEDEPYMRVMRPMMTKESCLGCHGKQGYQEGDVRGGFSVSVPMTPYLAHARTRLASLAGGHSVIWLVGLLGLAMGMRGIRERMVARDESEKALRESEARVRLLLDSTAEAIYALDMNGDCTMANPACLRLLGYDDIGLLLGRNMHELIHHTRSDGSTCPVEDCRIYKAFRQGRGTHVDDEVLWRANGSSFPAEYWSYPIFRDGEVMGAVVTFVDISERRVAEEERRSWEAHLRHAQKLESLGVLAGGVAHDFNNILLAIMGNADILLQDLPVGSQTRLCAEEIDKASRRAAGLTEKMLAFSGKGQFMVQSLNLSEVVDAMAPSFVSATPANVTLRMELDHSVPRVRADAGQVEQAVMNLVHNAFEAFQDGEDGSVDVSTGSMHCTEEYLAASRLPEKPGEGLYAFVEVADTGCGIDDETQGKAFEPFFTTKFPGRGLGLPAVLGIARAHGGAIVVDTAPSDGTRVRLLFPAEKEETA